VDIGDFGKNNDSSIYNNSVFNRKLRAGSLDIPDATFLPGKSDVKMPFVLVGDEAFAMTNAMLRPYGGKKLSEKNPGVNPPPKKNPRYATVHDNLIFDCSHFRVTNDYLLYVD
jgi:hypothetical protein